MVILITLALSLKFVISSTFLSAKIISNCLYYFRYY